jgi:hypothetical protein
MKFALQNEPCFLIEFTRCAAQDFPQPFLLKLFSARVAA